MYKHGIERLKTQVNDDSNESLAAFSLRRSSNNKRLEKYKEKIEKVNSYYDVLEEDIHFAIFEAMVDGMKYAELGRRIGVSRRTIYNKRNEMIEHIIANCYK